VLQIYGLREELNALFMAFAGSIAFAILMPLAKAVFPRPPFGAVSQADDGRWPLALPLLVALWLVWLIDVVAGRGEGAMAAVLVTAALAALSHLRTPRAVGWGRTWARPAQLALAALAAVAAVQALGADLVGFLATPAGRRLLGGAVDSALIVVLALFGWTALSRWIDSKIGIDSGDAGASAVAQAEGEGGTAKVGTRAQTLLPLIRTITAIALVVMVGLTVLSSFGIDITPLLAGAGIVGIAVGFGAQSLVRDIFSGIFFLVDDAFRVGEYIEFGEIRGEVERISIRSLTLRHHRGAVHTVPFGEIRSITNYNRDWVIMKLRFTLRYDTDVNKVKKIVKQIGAELAADPEYGPNLIEPPKSQGILEFADSGVIVRVKFKCKPREQFVLRRLLNERLMAEFAKAGIRFAFPTVTVERPGAADGEAEAAAQAALAATLPPARPA
jgi:small-conductance mechanosensitive channel